MAAATDGSVRSQLSGAINGARSGLGDQPLLRPVELSLVGRVVQPPRPLSLGATPAADRHPAVGLRSVVSIELHAYVYCVA
jgi:hypothetical protein